MTTVRAAAFQKTPTPTPVRSKPVHPLSHLYTEAEIGIGQSKANCLLSITDPTKLAHREGIIGEGREARRLALMDIAVRMAYQHLYTPQDAAISQKVYDIGMEARYLLSKYPAPAALENFRVHEAALLIEEKIPSLPAAPDLSGGSSRAEKRAVLESLIRGANVLKFCRCFQVCSDKHEDINLALRAGVIEAKRTALADYLFDWVLLEAGNWPKNIRNTNPRTAAFTRSSGVIKAKLGGLIGKLKTLNMYSPPFTYSLIDRLLVNTLTGLPFNIHIPF